jgi:adenylate cyclase
MAINDRTRIAIPIIVRFTLVGALAGAVYSYLTAAGAAGAGLEAFKRGVLSGGLIGAMLSALNIFVLEAPIGAPFRRTPFLLHLCLKALVYLIVFLGAVAASQWMTSDEFAFWIRTRPGDILFFFAVSLVISFLFDVNRLLGQNVLLSFMTGRYFRPRVEQRVFLLIDMKNSTAAAERLGEVDFHRLLNRFVGDLTGPIVLQKGQIHKYVGDELIITWPLAVAIKEARCLRACFGAFERIATLGPSYEREFGLRVDFRAALHCGPVVIGEMGTLKKEIALLGDALNTTTRIVDACRDRGEAAIASAALLQQLTVPSGVEAVALGPVELRGKKLPVELFALRAAAAKRVAAE